MPIVLDASVILKWFFEDEIDREKSLLLLSDHIGGDLKIQIPEFAYYEIIHVLRFSKYKLGLYSIRQAINSLFALKLNDVPFNKELFIKAVEVSFETSLSVYDSYYVALALNIKSPLVTSDKRLLEKCCDLSKIPSGFEVILLEKYGEETEEDEIDIPF